VYFEKAFRASEKLLKVVERIKYWVLLLFRKIIGGEDLLDIIFDINSALEKAKKEHEIVNSLIVALVAAILLPVGLILASALSGKLNFSSNTVIEAVIISIAILLVILFLGLITQLVVKMLCGKGDYFAGLTSVAYSSFVGAIGFTLTAILFSILGTILANAPFLAKELVVVADTVLTIFVLLALALVVFYRAIKELFDIDMTTALVAVGCTAIALATVVIFSTIRAGCIPMVV